MVELNFAIFNLIWLFWLVFTLKEENVKVILMEN